LKTKFLFFNSLHHIKKHAPKKNKVFRVRRPQSRENIDQPLSIEDTARELGMSVSGFHNHFKSVTAMSPLQFQKQLRLQEARRLMLTENMDVASASFQVGYEDPSYFSREYKKLFGVPPLRDVAKLRSSLANN
jgi:AraC-like DNA-binding protein